MFSSFFATGLHNDFRLSIFVAEVGGTTALTFLEEAIEVAHGVEARLIANLRHGVGGVHQQAGGMAQAHINDILIEVLAGALLEEAAEGRVGHAHHAGEHGQAQLVAEMLFNIVLHLQHAARIALGTNLGKGRRRELPRSVLLRQLVKDGHQLGNGIEAFTHLREVDEAVIDLHDGRHGEGEALLRTHKHFIDGGEGIGVVDAMLVVEIDDKLHRHLVDVVALTFMLLPDVLQVRAGDEHQVVLADDLAAVAHGAATAGPILHKVQLKQLMAVDGIGELLLVAVGHVHEVVVGQRGYLMQDS